jgi:L-threonylcarbamoyladenylate synthase
MVASVVSADAEKIIGSLMPGSITIVLPKKNIVPDTVTAGLNTVAVRMPESIAARAFIEQCGVPIAAPSANSSTRPSPTTWQAVKEDMDGKIDAIICGEPCDVGIESTVLDLTGVVPVVLRPGVVTPSEIAKILSKPVKIVTNPTDKVNSPGVRYRHYAPSVPAVLNIDGDSDKIVKFYRQLDTVGVRPVVLCQSDVDVGECETLPLGATDRDVAASIFRQLRAAEKQYDYIIVSYSSTGELSDSILNRLTKSCSGRIL